MANHKLIFSGPVGAGKTTAIRSLSDIETVDTDQGATDETRQRKSNTTVAMDYGILVLGEGERIHLYGTPGQDRFDFMWEILIDGGIGLILMLDNARPDPIKDMHYFLNAYADFIDGKRVAIGITRMDLQPTPTIDDYHAALEATGLLRPPIFDVDARKRDEVATLVRALLYSIEPGLSG